MTHEYTILFGGMVIRGRGAPDATAVAWAEDTVLAVGADGPVRAISRGDSRFVDLAGARVTALDPAGVLEAGAPADLAVAAVDPRTGAPGATTAVIRGGRVVEGSLGADDEAHGGHEAHERGHAGG